jgi:hypothetical protein
MDKERFMAFPAEITECLKGCNVDDVEFNIDFSDILLQKPVHEYLPIIVGELTDNCMDKGAKRILVTLSDNSLRVEDDIVEPNPQETLNLLNKIKDSEKMMTTKSKQREAANRGPGGGMGTKIVIGYLNKVGGNLEYSIIDGRIIAEATWV